MLREKHRNCVAPLGLKEDQRFDFVVVLCTCTCFVCCSEHISACVISGLAFMRNLAPCLRECQPVTVPLRVLDESWGLCPVSHPLVSFIQKACYHIIKGNQIG